MSALASLAGRPGVPDAVAAVRVAVDALLAEPVLRRRTDAVAAEAVVRSARASAALAGEDVALDVLRAGHVPDRQAAVALGALRAEAEVVSLVETWRRAPAQVLARLHLLAAADLAPADRVGRLRRPGESVGAESGPGPRLGAVPEPDEAAARVGAVLDLALTARDVPAVVVAAVVHAELLTVRPFGVADGVVARAAERLVLVERGLDRRAVSVPAAGHLGRAGEYADAVRGYRDGGPDGVARWLVHCAAAVADGATVGREVCAALLAG